jgi:transcriptional regulator with XRE-family HTH domain
MRKISPLKVEIIRRGLTQSDVAHDARISESRLSRILNGRVEPQATELRNLRQALGLKREEEAT